MPVSMIVSAGHGEYGDLRWPLVELIWEPLADEKTYLALFHAIDAGDDVEELAKRLFAERNPGVEPPADADLTWENIVRITGEREAVEAWQDQLVSELLGGPSGGDDDTFDYWPSGVRLARAVAAELGGEKPAELEHVVAEALAGSEWTLDELGLEVTP